MKACAIFHLYFHTEYDTLFLTEVCSFRYFWPLFEYIFANTAKHNNIIAAHLTMHYGFDVGLQTLNVINDTKIVKTTADLGGACVALYYKYRSMSTSRIHKIQGYV